MSHLAKPFGNGGYLIAEIGNDLALLLGEPVCSRRLLGKLVDETIALVVDRCEELAIAKPFNTDVALGAMGWHPHNSFRIVL